MPRWTSPLLFFTFLLCLCTGVSAQEVIGSQYVTLSGETTKAIDLNSGDLQALVLSWAEGSSVERARYRYTNQRGRLGKWREWSLSNEAGKRASRLITLPASARRVEVNIVSTGAVRLSSTAYAKTPTARPVPPGSVASTGACACPAPAVVTRDAWCPNGDCDPVAAPTPVQPRHLIVHHSGAQVAGTDYALVVRAIRDYHVNTNGWDDIGYNFLIAPDGTTYRGRGATAQGAHFCGANSGTLGICLLGNFDDTQVTAPAIDALTNLGSFLGCDLSIDPYTEQGHEPSGKTLPGLAGHFEGCSTECPGEALTELLPTLRAAISGKMERGCQQADAPQNLTASALSDGAVNLRWDAPANATSIFIVRSTPTPNDFALVAEVNGSLDAYIDDAPPAGGNYYRIRALVDGAFTAYSNEVQFTVSSSEAQPPSVRPRLARNPVRGLLEVKGLVAPVDQAFVSDASGRTILELPGRHPRWQVRPGELRRGKYWIMLFSGNEWYTVPFEYRP